MTNLTSKKNQNGRLLYACRIEDELEELRKLQKKFKELERYKRETLEAQLEQPARGSEQRRCDGLGRGWLEAVVG